MTWLLRAEGAARADGVEDCREASHLDVSEREIIVSGARQRRCIGDRAKSFNGDGVKSRLVMGARHRLVVAVSHTRCRKGAVESLPTER